MVVWADTARVSLWSVIFKLIYVHEMYSELDVSRSRSFSTTYNSALYVHGGQENFWSDSDIRDINISAQFSLHDKS